MISDPQPTRESLCHALVRAAVLVDDVTVQSTAANQLGQVVYEDIITSEEEPQPGARPLGIMARLKEATAEINMTPARKRRSRQVLKWATDYFRTLYDYDEED